MPMARLRYYSLQLSLALTAALLPTVVWAHPSVNVALQAAFDSGPYLLELLETAAEENSTCYFPLLDRIAEGVFSELSTDRDLYDRFLQVLQDDGHLRDPDTMSSFNFALSIRSAAPRIQAHYQYYNTSVEPSLVIAQDAVCPVWVHSDGKQYCSPGLEHAQQDMSGDQKPQDLPFDRILGDAPSPLVLYADIASPMFGQFHQELSRLAKDGLISYRLRYRPLNSGTPRPLFVNGYGVELALKRTDYIVIDDRDAEQISLKEKGAAAATLVAEDLTEDSTADLKPLSSSEVSRLGINAASFVMSNADPFGTLLRVSQDFPKHSSAIATHNATSKFLTEFRGNRAYFLPAGYNIMWINGVQMDPRHIDAFSLLGHLRHERKLIGGLRTLGLTSREAVNLLSQPEITKSQTEDDVQRYDYRDDVEGGGVILWLNDLEKDRRYQEWPRTLNSLLQRTYPGQLPPVRRDIHNVVIPVNLANPKDVEVVVQNVQVFVKRQIPVRFGLIPTLGSPSSVEQAKLTYYLHDTYGLAALLSYLEDSLSLKKVASPNKPTFKSVVKDRKPRGDRKPLSFEEVLRSNNLDAVLVNTKAYLKRLAADGKNPPFFANGAALSLDENWLQLLITRVSKDLETIQRGVVEGIFEEDAWLPELYLIEAAQSRNPLIIPEDESTVQILDLNEVYEKHKEAFDTLPRIPADPESPPHDWAHLDLVTDFGSVNGAKQLAKLVEFRKLHPELEILLLHNPVGRVAPVPFWLPLGLQNGRDIDFIGFASRLQSLEDTTRGPLASESLNFQHFLEASQLLAKEFGVSPGQSCILLNGRVIGPISSSSILEVHDLEQLLSFERLKRLGPTARAVQSLGLTSRITDPLVFARLTSLVTLSTISDIPEGIYDSGPTVRSNKFEMWNDTHSAISVSSTRDPSIYIVAAIDPTTEMSQRWIPILQVLSELSGVDVKLYLNPRENIQELPIKRFYRHILKAAPSFDDEGSLIKPQVRFTGVPDQALLNLGMDVPPSWLVAPKESMHDLDNLKLSSLKEGSNVDAVYELKHILIEGHSRDATTGTPPRGVQLLLGTEKNPHFADTIIMANLGYFQFKAQPGCWKITLKPGQSEKIFNLDSVGAMGYRPKPGDNKNEIALLSFQGKTLFPRLSRKPGHEEDEVLEMDFKSGSAMNYLSKGLTYASEVLSTMGSPFKEKHADINIFSVASGHLYERMLNIMMVSVMRHTKHTVKFWFIEQFLSPSFKSLLPLLAEEYGFLYEMVTYKWPHWLRGQREKQREIWGYKILFLDVLFPLSLDKVIFVDADQIVRTDMYELVTLDLEGAPYGFTPMCDSRESMEGFRFWKQGYWKNFLRELPYHISALYVVDLKQFRQIAAGDRLRGQYHTLSADPESLSNLDQDLPNHMQHVIPIKSLPQDWLWCETWCSDEALASAKTIDLCNNPLTKEPKLDRARRQVPEWTIYDEEIAALAKRASQRREGNGSSPEKDGNSYSADDGHDIPHQIIDKKLIDKKDEL